VAFAIALSAGDASATLSTTDHAAACNCGVKCRRGACCCGPRKPKETAPTTEAADVAADPSAEADLPDAERRGPCLGATPAGADPAAPAKTIAIGGDGSAYVTRDASVSARRGDRLPPPSSDRAAPADGSRLDRPPKTDPSA
jgi:hypothetical protein